MAYHGIIVEMMNPLETSLEKAPKNVSGPYCVYSNPPSKRFTTVRKEKQKTTFKRTHWKNLQASANNKKHIS
jgi:hypothetical protein